jgi:hypothetical protein
MLHRYVNITTLRLVKYLILTMNNPLVGDFVKTPKIHSNYLTSFTNYEVIYADGKYFRIIADDDELTHCTLTNDSHINNKDWTIIKKDELHSQP